MLLFADASQVTSETTLGDFIDSYLELRHGPWGVSIDEKSFEALVEEIWNATGNSYLHAAMPDEERGHVPAGDKRTSTLRLYPDEWVYLPAGESRSPGWQLYQVRVNPTDASAASRAVVQFATQRALLLPASGEPVDNGTPTITEETLEGYLFNALLRSGQPTEVVYFYGGSPTSAQIDAPPTTHAGGVSTVSGQATPRWLPHMWRYIDRMRHAAEVHAAAARELHELTVDGRMVVAVIGMLDHVLAIYERERTPGPPPTGFIARALENLADAHSPDHGLKLDIHALRAALPALRDKARAELVDSPTWPAIKHFNTTLANLKAIEAEKGFKAVYADFDGERAKYPATEQAFQMASADYIGARAIAPDSDTTVDTLLKAFWDLTPTDSPITQEIVALFSGHTQKSSKATDEASAIVSLLGVAAGNTPGPSSLWVALSRMGLVFSIGTFDPKGGQTGTAYRKSYRDYMARLANTAGITDEVMQQLEQKAGVSASRQPGKLARAFAGAAAGAEKLANEKQAGLRWTTGMSLLNLWSVFSGLRQFKLDRDAGKSVQAAIVDGALPAAQAGSGLAADIVQVLANPRTLDPFVKTGKALGIAFEESAAKAGALFGKAASALGKLNATLAGVFGIWTIVKSWKEGAWADVTSGAGGVLSSLGFWADVWVTKRAKQFVVQEATMMVAGMAIDTEILLAAGTAMNVVGILIVVGVLAYKNRATIMSVLRELSVPGPLKWVDTILTQLEAAKVIKSGSNDLQSALANVRATANQSIYVTWPMNDRVRLEVQSWGASADDLSTLNEIPVLGGTEHVGPW